MSTIRYISVLVGFLFYASSFAQQATVTAKNYDISDNLDLQAVASVFGDSKDLEDFERRLNDPDMRLSNLDLNRDGYVDYLRVIEAVEGRTHLVVIQAVLGQDVFQDVATIEVEKDRRNQVQVQVVGNSYIYGSNYIYEPIYMHTPSMFNVFWSVGYRPYYSSWYWNYYPTYYTHWQPYPVYTYVNHVHGHVNRNNRYVYASSRNSSRAVRMHRDVRGNAYERDYPQYSFSSRNNNVSNRYALEQSRGRDSGRVTSGMSNSRNNAVMGSSREVNTVRGNATDYRRGAAVESSRTFNNSGSSRVSNSQGRAETSSRVGSSRVNEASSRVNSNVSRTNVNPSRTADRSSFNTNSQPARIQRSSAPASNFTRSSSMSRGSSAPISSSRGGSMNTSSRGGGSVRSSSR